MLFDKVAGMLVGIYYFFFAVNFFIANSKLTRPLVSRLLVEKSAKLAVAPESFVPCVQHMLAHRLESKY